MRRGTETQDWVGLREQRATPPRGLIRLWSAASSVGLPILQNLSKERTNHSDQKQKGSIQSFPALDKGQCSHVLVGERASQIRVAETPEWGTVLSLPIKGNFLVLALKIFCTSEAKFSWNPICGDLNHFLPNAVYLLVWIIPDATDLHV